MWLSNSSIGRKVVMSVTGLALILFLTFHMAMNLVAIFSAEAYNMICAFLGANWYALVATAGLGFLVVVHIVYAFWLTMQNRAARGSERYAVNATPKGVEWASQNMLVWVSSYCWAWACTCSISGLRCSCRKFFTCWVFTLT